MKKLFFGVLTLLPALGRAQDKSFTLNVIINGIAPQAKAYLHYSLGQKTITDSVQLVNGKFSFSGKVEDPVKAQVYINHHGWGLPRPGQGHNDVVNLYLDKGNINVTATDSIKNATVEGSAINDEDRVFRAFLSEPNREIAQINAAYAAADEQSRNNPSFVSGLQGKMDDAVKKKENLEYTYVKDHPDSYHSLEALIDISGPEHDASKIGPLFRKLSSRIRNTGSGMILGKLIAAGERVAIGAMAPDFTQNDVNDKPVKFSQFRGKYVLLDFWASWCAPCRAENPNVVKAYERYKDKNFTIIGVSLDRPGKKNDWLAAIKNDRLTWTEVSDLKYGDNEVALLYGISAIPQNFLIDPSGKIIAKNLRGEELNKKLASIFH